jgi:hypothetical protein
VELEWDSAGFFAVGAAGWKGEVGLELRRRRSQAWSPWLRVSWISLGLSQRASAGVI